MLVEGRIETIRFKKISRLQVTFGLDTALPGTDQPGRCAYGASVRQTITAYSTNGVDSNKLSSSQ